VAWNPRTADAWQGGMRRDVGAGNVPGFHILTSPPGQQAPIQHINYTPATNEVHGRGVLAPQDQLNYTLLPDEAVPNSMVGAGGGFSAGAGANIGTGMVGAGQAHGTPPITPTVPGQERVTGRYAPPASMASGQTSPGTPPLRPNPYLTGPAPRPSPSSPMQATFSNRSQMAGVNAGWGRDAGRGAVGTGQEANPLSQLPIIGPLFGGSSPQQGDAAPPPAASTPVPTDPDTAARQALTAQGFSGAPAATDPASAPAPAGDTSPLPTAPDAPPPDPSQGQGQAPPMVDESTGQQLMIPAGGQLDWEKDSSGNPKDAGTVSIHMPDGSVVPYGTYTYTPLGGMKVAAYKSASSAQANPYYISPAGPAGTAVLNQSTGEYMIIPGSQQPPQGQAVQAGGAGTLIYDPYTGGWKTVPGSQAQAEADLATSNFNIGQSAYQLTHPTPQIVGGNVITPPGASVDLSYPGGTQHVQGAALPAEAQGISNRAQDYLHSMDTQYPGGMIPPVDVAGDVQQQPPVQPTPAPQPQPNPQPTPTPPATPSIDESLGRVGGWAQSGSNLNLPPADEMRRSQAQAPAASPLAEPTAPQLSPPPTAAPQQDVLPAQVPASPSMPQLPSLPIPSVDLGGALGTARDALSAAGQKGLGFLKDTGQGLGAYAATEWLHQMNPDLYPSPSDEVLKGHWAQPQQDDDGGAGQDNGMFLGRGITPETGRGSTGVGWMPPRRTGAGHGNVGGSMSRSGMGGSGIGGGGGVGQEQQQNPYAAAALMAGESPGTPPLFNPALMQPVPLASDAEHQQQFQALRPPKQVGGSQDLMGGGQEGPTPPMPGPPGASPPAGSTGPSGWQPPVNPQDVQGIGHRFGQDMEQGEPQHSGVDLQASEGTGTLSPVDGFVTGVEHNPQGLGLTVVIQGKDGSQHRLGHLQHTDAYPGMQVRAGQQIAKVGSTGNTTGAHLHWGVKDQQGNPVDNTPALPPGMQDMPPAPGTQMMGPPGGTGGQAQVGAGIGRLSMGSPGAGVGEDKLPNYDYLGGEGVGRQDPVVDPSGPSESGFSGGWTGSLMGTPWSGGTRKFDRKIDLTGPPGAGQNEGDYDPSLNPKRLGPGETKVQGQGGDMRSDYVHIPDWYAGGAPYYDPQRDQKIAQNMQGYGLIPDNPVARPPQDLEPDPYPHTIRVQPGRGRDPYYGDSRNAGIVDNAGGTNINTGPGPSPGWAPPNVGELPSPGPAINTGPMPLPGPGVTNPGEIGAPPPAINTGPGPQPGVSVAAGDQPQYDPKQFQPYDAQVPAPTSLGLSGGSGGGGWPYVPLSPERWRGMTPQDITPQGTGQESSDARWDLYEAKDAGGFWGPRVGAGQSPPPTADPGLAQHLGTANPPTGTTATGEQIFDTPNGKRTRSQILAELQKAGWDGQGDPIQTYMRTSARGDNNYPINVAPDAALSAAQQRYQLQLQAQLQIQQLLAQLKGQAADRGQQVLIQQLSNAFADHQTLQQDQMQLLNSALSSPWLQELSGMSPIPGREGSRTGVPDILNQTSRLMQPYDVNQVVSQSPYAPPPVQDPTSLPGVPTLASPSFGPGAPNLGGDAPPLPGTSATGGGPPGGQPPAQPPAQPGGQPGAATTQAAQGDTSGGVYHSTMQPAGDQAGSLPSGFQWNADHTQVTNAQGQPTGWYVPTWEQWQAWSPWQKEAYRASIERYGTGAWNAMQDQMNTNFRKQGATNQSTNLTPLQASSADAPALAGAQMTADVLGQTANWPSQQGRQWSASHAPGVQQKITSGIAA
jgi:hypothetical protein